MLIEDLPIHLARSATSFHQSATHYLETQKELLVNLSDNIGPDIKAILPIKFGGKASHLNPTGIPFHELEEETKDKMADRKAKREEMRNVIRDVQQDDKVKAVGEQVFAFIDFEGEWTSQSCIEMW